MHKGIRKLSLTVKVTTGLLIFAAFLTVLGVFNTALHWDIFGPKVESVLYGIFFSCMALSAIGVALTIVLGIQEIVLSFKAIGQKNASTSSPEPSNAKYLQIIAGIFFVLFLTITALNGANYFIEKSRVKYFKELSTTQLNKFNNLISDTVSKMPPPATSLDPLELNELIKSIEDLSYVHNATIYMSENNDTLSLWRYTTEWQNNQKKGSFNRFFVAKDFEEAILSSLRGDETKLKALNEQAGFVLYFTIKDSLGKPTAVIRLDGNPNENYRDYLLGS